MQQLLLTRPLGGHAWHPAGRADAAAALTADPPADGTRLALLHTPDTGRFLAHVVTHNGQAVAHVLLDVADTLDAQQAVQTWDSPMWLRDPDAAGPDLPAMLYLPVADAVNDTALKAFLDSPARRELMEFLIAAVLTAGPAERVFVAAPSDAVATALYGVTRALPVGLLDGFTFSTSEPDPLACPARVVGTLPADDLPDACYHGAGCGVNAQTGRRTGLPVEVPFAAFAVEALATGKLDALDEFRATWQRLGVRDAGLLDLVFRLARGTGTLTQPESAEALRNPAIAAWVSGRSDAMQQFLEWALDDRDFAQSAFSRAVVALRQKSEALGKLAATVQEQGLVALKASDTARTANAFEVVLPMVAPAKAATVWGDLLGKVSDPAALSWDMRWYLLPRFLRLKPLTAGQGIDPTLARWLAVPPPQLAPLLALDLPKPYPLLATLETLGDGDPPVEAVAALGGQPSLVPSVLAKLHAAPAGPARAKALFAAILGAAPHHGWALDLLRPGRGLPADLLDACVSASLDAEQVAPAALIREAGPALREHLAGKPSLEPIHRRFLEAPPESLLTEADTLDHLRRVADDAALSDETRERIRGVLTTVEYLREPSVDAEPLSRVAAALRLKPDLFPPRLLADVQRAVGEQLAQRTDRPAVQDDLEAALLHLGPLTDHGPTGLFRALLRDQEERRGFWKSVELPHAFLAVALGAVRSMELAQQLDNLESEAYSLAFGVARRGGRKVFDAIDRKTADWPRSARPQWNFLAKAVRPRGLTGAVRDGVMLLIGGTVGAATVYAWWRVVG